MDWTQVQATIVSLLVAGIAWLVNRFIGAKMNDETRKAATWAAEQGVAWVALKMAASSNGEAKHQRALQVAESLAPKAMTKLDATQKATLVDATYAKMKASLPHATTYSLGEVPVEVALPPPSRVPKGIIS